MMTSRKPLLTLTAADLMTETVVVLPQQMSLPTAAQLLSMHQISGAPVVDERGVCVGVLSATDFMNLAQSGRSSSRPPLRAENGYCQSWQLMESDHLPTEEIARHMTSAAVTVAPTLRIGEVAQRMVDAHIHRVIVVDVEGHPKGIVSSTDILAAVAYADPAVGQPDR